MRQLFFKREIMYLVELYQTLRKNFGYVEKGSKSVL